MVKNGQNVKYVSLQYCKISGNAILAEALYSRVPLWAISDHHHGDQCGDQLRAAVSTVAATSDTRPRCWAHMCR